MIFVRYAELIAANTRLSMKSITAYRAELAVDIINLFIKVFAVSALWNFLQSTGLGSDDISHLMPTMPTYAMMGAILSVILSWWRGPQEEVGEKVRNGTIVYDLIREQELPVVLLLRDLGRSTTRLVFIATPVCTVAMVFMGLRVPDLQRALEFALSIALGWTLLFGLNLIVSLLATWTVQLVGIQHAYHGLFMLASGVALPFEFYPDCLSQALRMLPFSSVFHEPLSIWALPLDDHEVLVILIKQFTYTTIVFAVFSLLWRRARNAFVILGG